MPVLQFLYRAEDDMTFVSGNSAGILTTSIFGNSGDFSGLSFSARVQGGFQTLFDWEQGATRNDVWFHSVVESESGTTSYEETITFMGNGVELVRYWAISSTQFRWEYHNGTNWITVATVDQSATAAHQIDVQLNFADSGGYFRFYTNGNLDGELTGDTLLRGESGFDAVRMGNRTSNTTLDMYYTETLVADEDTRDFECDNIFTSADGFHTEWTIAEGNIDDGPDSVNDATFGGPSAVDDRHTFTVAGFPSKYDSFSVVGCIHATRNRKGAASGFDLQAMIRKSSTDYNSATETGAVGVFGQSYFYFDNDPSTGSPWADAAAIDTAEHGFQAK